jgi:predicted metal-dependent HD superfamily phosphohydrolase
MIVYDTQRQQLEAASKATKTATLDCHGLYPRNDTGNGFVIASHEGAKQSGDTARQN